MEIRVDAVVNSRVQELYDQYVLLVGAEYPDDPEEQERLKQAFVDEQIKLAREREEKEEKGKKEKGKAREESKQRPSVSAWFS